MRTIYLLLSLIAISFAIQCLDNNSNPVDWWFMLKLGQPASPYGGFTYIYSDATTDGSFVVGNINDTNAAYNTVQQLGLYGSSVDMNSVGWGMWNDQTHWNLNGPCDDHEKDENGYIYGHTKGLIGFDSNTAFWLTHSAPGFPYGHTISPSNWYYPYAQSIYGQNFYCISIDPSDVDSIGNYLQYYHAYVYDWNIPSSFNLPNFQNFVYRLFTQDHGTISFSSLGGRKYQAYGKYASMDADLYEDYIAPALQTGLISETWCGGTYGYACMPSYCAGAPIVNPSGPQGGQSTYAYDSVSIGTLNFGNGLEFGIDYNHAKFCLAYNPHSTPVPWFCSCDNNRATTQRLRGGGGICTQDPQMWKLLNNAVVSLNTTCPN